MIKIQGPLNNFTSKHHVDELIKLIDNDDLTNGKSSLLKWSNYEKRKKLLLAPDTLFFKHQIINIGAIQFMIIHFLKDICWYLNIL